VTSFVAWAKQIIREQRLRKRFPRSVIHAGAIANKDSIIGEYAVMFRNATLLDSTLGAYSYVQADSVICNTEVGPFCSIAGGVNIGLGAHPTFMVSTNPVFYDNEQPLPKFFTQDRLFTQVFPRTIIGADVWIGQGAMVKAGVKIGTGAVIGAGSVVVKDIFPYAVAVGNPCRPIKLRFSEDLCQRLLGSRWWEFDEARLEKLAPLFADPELLLAALESGK
jgi:acetyltransferase-like isoleucine patch superfamily enzyme